MDHEGRAYAAWLAERGIAGIVVKYRVSGNDAFKYGFPVPFLDARRAIRTVRANAEKWGVDPKKIGVMGSSAGGHLASLCTTRFDDKFDDEGKDLIDGQSCRPDFSILIYPVISMEPPLAHGPPGGSGNEKSLAGCFWNRPIGMHAIRGTRQDAARRPQNPHRSRMPSIQVQALASVGTAAARRCNGMRAAMPDFR